MGLAASRRPMTIKPFARISIKTDPNPMPPGQVPKGQDVFVEVVLPDGTRHPIQCIEAKLSIVRAERVTATLVLIDPVLDLEAIATDIEVRS